MHALITGAGGFVGGAISRVFLGAGWKVTGLCRKRRPAGLGGPQFDVVESDLEALQGLPDRYDFLVHCAAEVPAYCPDEERLYRSNVDGTRRLLEHAHGAGAAGVAYMSSMAVYGEISVPVVSESTAPGKTSVYGKSKAEGETALAGWASGKRAAVSIRLPGVVGAGGRNNFLCDTLQIVLAGGQVTASNPQAPFNNVVHVGDLAAFVAALPGRMPAGHQPLTIAASDPLPMRGVLARLHERAGKPERVRWQEDGAAPFLISFERARSLGYRPASVADSIDRFVADTVAAGAP